MFGSFTKLLHPSKKKKTLKVNIHVVLNCYKKREKKSIKFDTLFFGDKIWLICQRLKVVTEAQVSIFTNS